MDVTAAQERTALRLEPFSERHAAVVAGWVKTPEQLRQLAPSTEPPLTVQKVRAWHRPGGRPILLIRGDDPTPIGYAELNPMRKERAHLWMGHVVLDPAHRGRGLGRVFVEALLSYAFDRVHADRVSLIVFPENIPAVRCYLRAGFTVVGDEYCRFGGRDPRWKLLRLQAVRPALGIPRAP